MSSRKASPKPKPEPELRKVSMTLAEVELLLKILQTDKRYRGENTHRLIAALDDLWCEFNDAILKIKEQLIRSKSNAFFVDGYVDTKKLKNNGEPLRELAHMPAKELRKLLEKKRAEVKAKAKHAKA